MRSCPIFPPTHVCQSLQDGLVRARAVEEGRGVGVYCDPDNDGQHVCMHCPRPRQRCKTKHFDGHIRITTHEHDEKETRVYLIPADAEVATLTLTRPGQ